MIAYTRAQTFWIASAVREQVIEQRPTIGDFILDLNHHLPLPLLQSSCPERTGGEYSFRDAHWRANDFIFRRRMTATSKNIELIVKQWTTFDLKTIQVVSFNCQRRLKFLSDKESCAARRSVRSICLLYRLIEELSNFFRSSTSNHHCRRSCSGSDNRSSFVSWKLSSTRLLSALLFLRKTPVIRLLSLSASLSLTTYYACQWGHK